MHQRQTLLAPPLILVAFTASAEVEFGAQWLQFDYREESDAGSILNEESGDIPGVYLAWRNQIDRLWLELEGHYAKGSVDYQGGTQSGRPLSTETDQRLVLRMPPIGMGRKMCPASGLVVSLTFSL